MRQEFPKKVKLAAFERADGKCEICTARLAPGNLEYDHVMPAWLGGDATLDNCRAVCRNCHRGKTRTDVKQIAKAKRQKHFHVKAKQRKGRPMAGTKASGWRHKLSGEWERRE